MSEFSYTAPEPLVIEFSTPLKAGKGTIDRLSLREPRAGEVQVAEIQLNPKAGGRGARLYQRALIVKISGLPEAAIDDLPVSVFTRASNYLQGLVEAGLENANAGADKPDSNLTITFDPPVEVFGVTYNCLTVNEPTLGQMTTAESAIGDMSPQRIRMFQQNLVTICSGEKPNVIANLPITVLNRAASFLMGFSSKEQEQSI